MYRFWESRFSKCIFENYAWVIVLNAIMLHLIGKGFLLYIFTICIYYLVLRIKKEHEFNAIDLLFFILVIWMIVTWLFNSFANKFQIILYTLVTHVAFMMSYFVGRFSKTITLKAIVEKSIFPISVCCLVGIWWFFSPPTFLANDILEKASEGSNRFELLRLRSIFPSPYHLSYFCSLSLIVLFFKYLQGKLKWGIAMFLSIVLLYSITLMLCMMRGPIAGVVFSVFIALFQYKFLEGKILGLTKYFIASIFLFMTLSIVVSHLDMGMYDSLIGKYVRLTDDTGDFLGERLVMYNTSYSLCGDGVGRYSLYARSLGMPSMEDSEYVKLLSEQGYLGLCFFFIFVILVLHKVALNIRHLSLEMCIVLFFLTTMIGADSLSTADKHSFIFWFAIGRIASYKNDKYRNNPRSQNK